MTSVEFFIQQAITAISIGSLYALMAIGLAMVFGILRLINFAPGALIMVGSYATLILLGAGLPLFFFMVPPVCSPRGRPPRSGVRPGRCPVP